MDKKRTPQEDYSQLSEKTSLNRFFQEFPLPTEDNIKLGMSFDETRRRLNEEMREEDERLQQLLADEEAEMSKDEEEEEDSEEREEQMRKERERNRMERLVTWYLLQKTSRE